MESHNFNFIYGETPMNSEQPSLYIVHVTVGDPNSHLPLTTSFGMFESLEQAQGFIDTTYEDTPHICEVVPLNIVYTN